MTRPVPEGDMWKVFFGVGVLRLSGTDKAVLTCLIEHANSETGLCYPSETTIAAEIGRDLRAVERSIANLIRTPYLTRQRRKQTSSIYTIKFAPILKAFDDYKARQKALSTSRQKRRANSPTGKRPILEQ